MADTVFRVDQSQSMREQEPIIGGYVDLLVRRLRENCVEEPKPDEKGAKLKPKALDMKTWVRSFDPFYLISVRSLRHGTLMLDLV